MILTIAFLAMLYRFSPVAGIQWVETFHHKSGIAPVPLVSVPLPGFSGLRLAIVLIADQPH